MRQKPHLALVRIMTLCALALPASAVMTAQTSSIVSSQNRSVPRNIPQTRKANTGNTGRQKMPALSQLFCCYNYTTGELEFSIPDNIGPLYVEVCDCRTGAVWTGCVSQAEPVMAVGITAGAYEITCETPEGDVYSATFDF